MYRSREWNQEERQLQKSERKLNWWNAKGQKIQYKSLVFVTPTPGGTLVKELKAREEELNKNNPERIKFVEKGGRKLKDIISAKNPFKKKKCVQKTCTLCAKHEFIETDSDNITVPCNANNVGYRWLCITCTERNILKVYKGETGRSASQGGRTPERI